MTALSEELALPEYAALTDQECYDSLTLRDIEINVPVLTRDIEIYLQSEEKLYTIRTHTSDIAKEVVMIFDRFDEFDMSISRESAVLVYALTALVNNSILTVSQATAIRDSGKRLISRVEELGITNYHLGYIAKARL